MTKTSPSEGDPIGKSIDKIMEALKARPEAEVKAAEQAEEERQARLARDDARRKFAAAGIPERHAAAISSKEGPWAAAWESISPRLGTGAIIPILGPRGTGKTQLAVEAVRYVTGRGGAALYIKAMGFFLDVREAMRSDEKSEKAAIRSFSLPRLLVIDAMEVRGETDFENRILDYVIDLRYDSGMDTILISNQTREEFSKSVGPSIISRVHQVGDTIECNWQSFRGKSGIVFEPPSIERMPGRMAGDDGKLRYLA